GLAGGPARPLAQARKGTTMATAGQAGDTAGETFQRRRLIGAAIMVACAVVCVLDASGVALKVTVGLLMLAAELGLIFVRRGPSPPAGLLASSLVIAAGLTVTVLVPRAVGEVPVVLGAAGLPGFLSPGWPRSIGIAVVSVAFGVSVAVISGSPVGLLAGAGAWAIADRSVEHAAFRAERDRALALLAEVEASRQAQREAAAVEERNRIAREMHDVLAHSLAGLSMQLQAIRAVAAAEGASPSITVPIDRAAELARAGVQEARAAVGVLRAPRLHGLDDLEGLVRGFPGEVGMHVDGQPGRLGPEAGHAVYRAVQEAMTNTARYATGSGIEVAVTWGPAQLRVRVSDHGLPAGHQPSGVKGSGTGIKSMTDRIEAAGGRLTAGPAPNGSGWLVEITVPVIGGPDGEVSV
ncbi:MAG: sensor histidine kinase, partial [Trebonia sp.]